MADVTDGEAPAAVVEVEFVLRDDSYPFTFATADGACRFELAEMVPRPEGRFAEFFDVTGADPDRIESLAAAHDGVDATLLAEHEDGGLFEFLVAGNCPAFRLAELGGLPREVVGTGGEGRIVAEIPAQYDPAAVVGTFLEDHPRAELAAKREAASATPPFSDAAFRQVVHTHLTDRQREVLRTAFEAGYYDWPRGCTGEDVAEELGITSATFSEHVHAAERNLLGALFERPGSPAPDGA